MKTNQERLAELLIDWEEAAERGEPTNVDALCHDCPELKAELLRLIEVLEKTQWIERVFSPDEDSLETSGSGENTYREPLGVLSGRYQLLELVGEGGYAKVYKAFDQDLHRLVAVKFPKQLKASEGLLREARRVVQLRHPSIVSVVDLGREGDRVYIVSELVTGGTLAQRLEQPIARAEAVRWTIEVAEALQYAHEQGIVHLDVKPANILLDRNERALLTDFGIAASPQPDAALLQSKGTLQYMSPEQVTRERLGHRSDIYSLGVTLHQLLTGTLPYRATQSIELAREIAQGKLANLVADEPLRGIVQKALSLNPKDRYQAAEALAAALRSVQVNRRVISRRGFIGAAIIGATATGGALAYRYQAAATEPARWLAAATAATPERQIEMVTARLKQLNPGFNAAIESKVIDGQVQEWSMPTDLITDISPLRALSGLKKLTLTGPIEPSLDIPKCHGNLSDLAPLRGLQLESLVVPFNPKLNDLSPLEGMPLNLLQIAHSSVTDLSPLRGMPLKELRAGGAPLSDLSVLESAPIRILTLDRTKVQRLPNLRSTPLEMLLLQFTPLESLDGIQGTPIRHLECHETPLSDLTPIKSLKNLWGMTIYKTKVTDLSPLIESGGLRILYCDYVPERDREIIAKIPRLEIVNDRPLAELLK